MLLAIDIGNTNIVLGVFDHGRLIDHFRAATRLHLTVDEGRLLIGSALRKMHLAEKDVTHVVVGSVVPMLTSIFESTAQAGLECRALVVSHRIKLPITIGIDQPEQLGADRIANAVAGYRKFGGPVIIVDFGTATTFDVVDDRGTYLGGVITAGPETAMAELARKAARLFEVRLA
ncbi:MAG TPA: type III pantothenate kinase, partial [Candidatus Deferrimicrobium sp.]|nr:type III pantothenate kinase [Candidatus Deferrimicrobium sp.]